MTIDIIKGRWNKNIYIIEKELGRGNIGTVYLVRNNKGKKIALKCSDDIASLTTEFNVLKKLSLSFIPKVYDLDDAYIKDSYKYFFVMEYIEGICLNEHIKNKSNIEELLEISYELSKKLYDIYKLGYTYWDIKFENIIIEKNTKKLKLIDFGGVTKNNHSIKEYTPSYNINSFLDTPFYDDRALVFSVNLLLISSLTKQSYNPLTNNIEDIIYSMKPLEINDDIKTLITRGLKGKYNISDYIYDINNILNCNENLYIIKFIDRFFLISLSLFLIFLGFLFKIYII